jgi:hypothetical protein
MFLNRYKSKMHSNHQRSLFVDLRMTIMLVAVLSTIFVTTASGQSGQRAGTSSRELITTAEIEKYGTSGSVHDLVHALRKSWLNVKDMSLRETARIKAVPNREAEVTPAEDGTTLTVYLDNVRVGGMEELRSLSLAGVLEVRYFTAGQAMRRWGSGHDHGAIEVITSRRGETPDSP